MMELMSTYDMVAVLLVFVIGNKGVSNGAFLANGGESRTDMNKVRK
jgi:hypothetical protein